MGEVEFVVMDTPSGVLLTTGVDLFDEEIEQSDIERSKTTCATPIARAALRLDAVAKRWDDFRIWMRFDGRLVQDGSVADMMEPHKLLELAAGSRPKTARTVLVYSGSMPYVETPGKGLTRVEFGIEGKGAGERVVHRFLLQRG